MSFQVGDKVVYPNQGVCAIEEVCDRAIAGRSEQFFMLRILSNDSTVMVPVSNVENVGLRQLCTEEDLRKLCGVLGSEFDEPEQDWKNRYKENVEKMKTGCLFEVGQVLQNLYYLSYQKPLSFREKKMYDRARHLVVSEIAMVRELSAADVETFVDELLSRSYQQVMA